MVCDVFSTTIKTFFVDRTYAEKFHLFSILAGKPHPGMDKQLVLVANAHMHWDPEYSDVKLVQTMMFLSEVKNIIDKASRSLKTGVTEHATIPLVLCADLNSLPDSGMCCPIPVVTVIKAF